MKYARLASLRNSCGTSPDSLSGIEPHKAAPMVHPLSVYSDQGIFKPICGLWRSSSPEHSFAVRIVLSFLLRLFSYGQRSPRPDYAKNEDKAAFGCSLGPEISLRSYVRNSGYIRLERAPESGFPNDNLALPVTPRLPHIITSTS